MMIQQKNAAGQRWQGWGGSRPSSRSANNGLPTRTSSPQPAPHSASSRTPAQPHWLYFADIYTALCSGCAAHSPPFLSRTSPSLPFPACPATPSPASHSLPGGCEGSARAGGVGRSGLRASVHRPEGLWGVLFLRLLANVLYPAGPPPRSLPAPAPPPALRPSQFRTEADRPWPSCSQSMPSRR